MQLAGARRAGEADAVDVHVQRERLAGRVAEAGQHVEHAVGNSGLEASSATRMAVSGDFSEGLRMKRVAGRERRADLPGRHDQREVPRHDRADHADRLARDERERVGTGGRHFVVHLVDRLGVPGDAARARRDVHREAVADRLAHVERLEQRELVAVREHQFREAQQHALALARRLPRPRAALERARAAATARSTSAASVEATLAMHPPSIGLTQSNVAPDAAAT